MRRVAPAWALPFVEQTHDGINARQHGASDTIRYR